MATKMRQVKFSAMVNQLTLKNGELKIDLRTDIVAGADTNIKLLQNFKGGEELTITFEPKQLNIEDDAE